MCKGNSENIHTTHRPPRGSPGLPWDPGPPRRARKTTLDLFYCARGGPGSQGSPGEPLGGLWVVCMFSLLPLHISRTLSVAAPMCTLAFAASSITLLHFRVSLVCAPAIARAEDRMMCYLTSVLPLRLMLCLAFCIVKNDVNLLQKFGWMDGYLSQSAVPIRILRALG